MKIIEPLHLILPKIRNRHFLAMDLLLFVATPALALILRTDGVTTLPQYFPSLLVATFAFLLIKVLVFYRGGFYSRYWRYASIDELVNITVLSLLVLIIQSAFFFFVLKGTGWVSADFPRSIPVLDGLLTLLAVGGPRYGIRLVERLQPRPSTGHVSQRVVIAGAGWAGVEIVKEMRRNPQLGMDPVGFVDDDSHKKNMRIKDVPVLGRCDEITKVCEQTGTTQVIIAMPTAPGAAIGKIVRACAVAGIHAKTIPGVFELLGGTVSINQLREIRIEDLLRREPIKTDTTAVADLIRGKRVLVTGGGGSIGRELCRQVLRSGPKTLVILGHGENSVFEIENELLNLARRGQERTLDANHEPLGGEYTRVCSAIADIRFANRLSSIFDEHRPQVVFHAAAHKHVHLMEMNPAEAITNNVQGTQNLLDCSLAAGVEHFVMISTDKAVNPTGIMGASKRVAELLVHQAAERSGKAYVAVRFGNVLGSRGSVVLTFQQQIAAGGPVTITHPDMVRFFMTIPEAVQLVLQAATLGQGGEVFMLDMGQPVKIVDLAHDLIKLSGLEVGHDIEVAFTGLRPGEKLFEEMFTPGEEYVRTRHEKVFIAGNAGSFVPSRFGKGIGRLFRAAEQNDEALIVNELRRLLPEFRPPTEAAQRESAQDEVSQIELAPGDDLSQVALPSHQQNSYITATEH